MASTAETTPQEDLVELLKTQRPDIRKAAIEAVVVISQNPEDRKALKDANIGLVLGRLVGDIKEVARPALVAIINLCDEPLIGNQLLKTGTVSSLMECLQSGTTHGSLIVKALANLTRTNPGAAKLFQQDQPLMGLYVRKLVVWYLKPVQDGTVDAFEYAGQVISNVLQIKAARTMLLHPERGIFKDLMPMLKSESVIRRRGVAAIIKNLCFEGLDSSDVLLDPQAALIPNIMINLMGSEPYTAKESDGFPVEVLSVIGRGKREPDAIVRRNLIEGLQLLASGRPARELMRKLKLYSVIKKIHLELEEGSIDGAGTAATKTGEKYVMPPDDDETCNAIIHLVDFLMRDEVGAASAEEELKETAEAVAAGETKEGEEAKDETTATAADTAATTAGATAAEETKAAADDDDDSDEDGDDEDLDEMD